ncbi:putative neuroblastoma breakpoint family member 8 [Pan paniscus]|uniref:putative neuroblastoma breakpoint family member 8 n=1 Tax=Pan paniscus TaxID=9597 RepID=UPI003003C3DC
MNILEINEKLRAQLAEKKQQFRSLQEKCFVTQLAGFLANGQKKYKYEECEDLIKSMLRNERRQFKEEKLAEQLKQAEELRQYKVLVHSQERELTQLKEKLREGRDAARSLNEHLQALLTPDEPDKSQGQDLQEQLAEGCRLAQQLVQKLSPENDEDVQVEEAEKVQKSSPPREVQKAEESKVPEDSLEECAITCSNSHGPCDSNQPHKNIKITFEEDEVNSPLVVDRESSHGECQDALNILPVPGPTSSATNVSMVVSAGPLSSEKAEMNILEINEKLRPQLAEKKQQFRSLQEKCFVTQLAGFLANGQKKYKYEECEDLIKSMLRNERRQFKEEKLAEQLKQAEELRQYKVLVHSQERELTQLKEKLREGRDAARSLNEHLQALLTPDEPDKSQGQDLQEQLAEGCRLAQQLVQKLSPENDEDVQVEEAEKVQKSSPPREVQKAEESKVPEDSLEECAITCSNSHGPCDSNQPHKNIKITFEEDEVNSPLVVDRESSHGECQDALNILPVPGPTSSATNVSMVVSAGPLSSEKAEMNILEINEKLRPQLAEKKQQFRSLQEKCFVTQLAGFLANGQKKYKYEECEDLIKSMLRNERRQFKEEKLAEQLKQAEELRQYKVLVHSQERELTQLKEKLREGRDAARSLNEHLQALLTPDEPDKSQGQDLQEQLAEGCRLAQQLVQKLSPENDEDVQVEEAEKVQKSSPPREVQKAEESKVPEDSLEECAITCSNSHGPCDSNQPHKNIKITFEEDEVNSPLVVDRESSHGECQDALNILPVPGPTSSATNVSMVVSAGPLSSEKAEMNILEINEKLRPQLAEKKQQFRSLQEKCFVTQLAGFLANGQKKYKYEECEDLIKSMLRNERRQFKEEKLAEQLKQAEELRQYKVLVHSQERELTQLKEKLWEGRDAARSLNEHLQALLTPDEPDKSQGQDLQEQLAEGCRLAQQLVQKLSPENDEDVQVEEAEKVQKSSPPREVQKAEESKVPEDSLEECAITCSNSHGPCDSNQPHKNIKITFEEDEVNSPLVVDRESSHGECQDALNILPVPGPTSSATNVSMVVSAGPLSSEKAEMNILEINEKLRPQLAEKKQQFRSLQEKCFVTQLAGFLANGQKKYKYEECEDLIKSMLRNERRQFKEEKLAEQLKQAEELRQYKVLVHSQERELTQLKEKLREGRDAARSLNEHLQALLTPDEPDKSQGQDLQEQLAEGCRLAQQLVQKLSPENDEDVQVEEAEKVQKSSPPREVQKAEESKVPEDSLEECAITCSNSHGPCDSNQPHKNIKITFEEDEVNSPLVVDRESSHGECQDALNILPVPGPTSSATNVSMVVSAGPLSSEKAEMNILEINEKLRPQLAEKKQQFRSLQEKCFVTQLAGFLANGQKKYKYEECEDLIKSMLRNERRQFKEEKLAEQLKQAEELRQYKVLVHSQERELTQLKEKLWEGRDAARSLNEHLQALLTPDEPDKSQGQDLQEQLAEGCRLAQQLVQKLSPENDEDVQVEEAEKVQKSSPPREVQKAEESKVPEDSLEECAITCSNSHGPCDSNQPHKNIKITFEEDEVNSPLVVDRESSHGECQDALNILPVPGPTSSATNVSMVVSAGPLSSEKAEMNILEINEKLRPQLAEKKQQFRSLQEKCFVTQLAGFLANGQKKYKYEECEDLIKSMLRNERRQFKEEKLAEQLKQAEELRQYKVLVHSQERELTQLKEKLWEGRDAARSLNEHLQALLTPDEPDKSQGQDLQEQLAEGCRLAQQLVQKLSPENDEDVQVEEAEKVQKSSPPREVQKAEESKVPEDSLEECAITCSNSHGPCDSNQPHKNIKITFEEDEVNSPLVVDRESSHGECQDALNILPVPGPTSSATNVSMVVSAGPLSSEKAEMNILEINEKLRPQLAEKKQQFRSLQEKCFVTQLAGFLANGQKKYKYEECEDLIKSMLRNERRQFKEEKLAEQLKQAEELRQYKVLVHSQERELTQLKEKLREGRDAARSLNEHLQALLTPDEPDKSQGQDLQEQLAEGCRLAQQLVQKLSPENDNDDDEDVQVEVAEKVQKSSAPRDMQKAEEKEVPEDSLEECAITCSNSHGPYDSNQPHRKTKITFEEDKVDSTLIGSSSHVEWEVAVHIIPENESDDEEEEERGPVSPRNLQESEEEEVPQESWDEGYSTLSIPPEMLASYQSYSSTFHSLEEQQVCMAVDIGRHRWDQVKKEDQEATGPRLSRELLEVVEPEVLQDSLDRCYSTPSGCLEQPDSCQAYGSSFYALEEKHVGFSLDVGEIEKKGKGKKRRGRRSKKKRRRGRKEGEEDQNPPCPRLNGGLMEVEEPEVLQDSLDRCYSTPSGCLELTDSCQPYRSAFYVLEQQRVGLAVDMDEIEKYQEVEEDQDPSCPRLSRELLDDKGPEVLQDSLDRCYSTPSGYLELPDLGQPYSSAVYSLEEQYLGLALDVDRIKKDQEEEEDQGPPCPRLSRELLDEKGPEVLQDSLDRCYSTPSSCLEQPDSCQAYGSSFYALEEKHVGFSLDVGEIEKKGKGKKRRGRRSKKKRRRGRKEGEEDQNPPCPRLNGGLMEVEEPEVLQDSLDRCYSTPSMYFELPDSFQHYRSVFYSFEEQHISFALYVDNRFFTLTVTSLHLVFQMEVIFPQ